MLIDILNLFRTKRVLVVGDVMLDEYLWGDAQRISPEAPVPVVELKQRNHVPGGAANTASNVVALGGCVSLVGVVGADYEADLLRKALAQRGISCENLIVDKLRPTTTKTRIIAHNQQLIRVDREVSNYIVSDIEDRLIDIVYRQILEVDVVLISDYAKGLITQRLAQCIIEKAKEMGKPVVVDPKGKDYGKYKGSTVVTPNSKEAILALNHLSYSPEDLFDVGCKLIELLEGTAVLITMGPEGMSIFEEGGQPIHMPTVAHHVYDVTGAGDTVVATLALALASGADLVQAAKLANTAAGIKVGKVGTATVSLKELLSKVHP